MSTLWDAAIVGAGPAGSAFAIRLARKGHRVVLLDRASFPRPKPCGESINPGALRELEELGLLTDILSLPHARVEGWRIHPHRAPCFEGRYPADHFGIGIARATFDDRLVRQATGAGAELRTGIHIVDVIREGSRICGVRGASGEEIRARLVVGADGLRSVLVRRLGYLRRTPLLRKVALTAHVEVVDGVHGSWGELHLRDADCIGLAAVAPQRANVVMVLPSPAPQIGGDRAGYFDRQLHSLPALADARRCTPVRATGPFDWPTRHVVGDGVILIGDAAGYFDPFTGQGIYRALRSARMAAAVAHGSLSSGNCSRADLERYEIRHRREFRAARALQSLIEQVTSRPPLMRGAALILRRWPELAGRLVATAGDLLPPHRLLLPTPKLH